MTPIPGRSAWHTPIDRTGNSIIYAEDACALLWGVRSEALTKVFLLTLATRTFLEPEKSRNRPLGDDLAN